MKYDFIKFGMYETIISIMILTIGSIIIVPAIIDVDKYHLANKIGIGYELCGFILMLISTWNFYTNMINQESNIKINSVRGFLYKIGISLIIIGLYIQFIYIQ